MKVNSLSFYYFVLYKNVFFFSCIVIWHQRNNLTILKLKILKCNCIDSIFKTIIETDICMYNKKKLYKFEPKFVILIYNCIPKIFNNCNKWPITNSNTSIIKNLDFYLMLHIKSLLEFVVLDLNDILVIWKSVHSPFISAYTCRYK